MSKHSRMFKCIYIYLSQNANNYSEFVTCLYYSAPNKRPKQLSSGYHVQMVYYNWRGIFAVKELKSIKSDKGHCAIYLQNQLFINKRMKASRFQCWSYRSDIWKIMLRLKIGNTYYKLQSSTNYTVHVKHMPSLIC